MLGVTNKKGLSEIVSTLLIIMIAIASILMISAFIVPMIRENTQKSKVCFDLRDKISVIEGDYTCSEDTQTRVMIGLGESDLIEGIVVSLTSMGTRERYELREGGSIDGVEMMDGSSILRLPEKGGAETYVFNLAAERVEITPLLRDYGCEVVASSELNHC